MEVLAISKQIERLIDAIRAEGTKSKDLILAKAENAVAYDKAMAVSTLHLKADKTPATLVRELAKGSCTEQLLGKIVAEETLKAHWERLKYLQAQLNGYQSINRHLESTTK